MKPKVIKAWGAEALEGLYDRVSNGIGNDGPLNVDIGHALAPQLMGGRFDRSLVPAPEFTGNLADAAMLVETVLPGWWWKCGTCCVSDDACMAPDYTSPIHGDRLHQQFPLDQLPAEFDGGFDVDRRPPGNVPRALLESLLLALIAIRDSPILPNRNAR